MNAGVDPTGLWHLEDAYPSGAQEDIRLVIRADGTGFIEQFNVFSSFGTAFSWTALPDGHLRFATTHEIENGLLTPCQEETWLALPQLRSTRNGNRMEVEVLALVPELFDFWPQEYGRTLDSKGNPVDVQPHRFNG